MAQTRMQLTAAKAVLSPWARRWTSGGSGSVRSRYLLNRATGRSLSTTVRIPSSSTYDNRHRFAATTSNGQSWSDHRIARMSSDAAAAAAGSSDTADAASGAAAGASSDDGTAEDTSGSDDEGGSAARARERRGWSERLLI